MTDIVDALRAVRAGDHAGALRIAERTDSVLAGALSSFLRHHTDLSESVYTEPAAFQAFIAGGGNVGLYDATADALAAVHRRHPTPSVLDIGCGDGAAIVPALQRGGTPPRRVELVEVSAALLGTATVRLRAIGIDAVTHEATAQDFTHDLTSDQQWDVVESTFALHALPTPERDGVLRNLHPHVRELVIVEFDVPDLAPDGDERLQFLADSYEQGLAEYATDRDLVADGFLVPVLIGQLDPDAARMTYEQPTTAWADQLTRAGYTDVTTTDLYPYWSSPAFVMTARGGAHSSGDERRQHPVR